MVQGCGTTCMKYLLFAFNFLFWVSIILFSLGLVAARSFDSVRDVMVDPFHLLNDVSVSHRRIGLIIPKQ